MATNPKKSKKKSELEKSQKITLETITLLSDCLMDVFDEHDIKSRYSTSYPYWNYVYNNRHGGYFSNRETGILISSIKNEKDIVNSINKLRNTIQGITGRRYKIRSTRPPFDPNYLVIKNDLFISIS